MKPEQAKAAEQILQRAMLELMKIEPTPYEIVQCMAGWAERYKEQYPPEAEPDIDLTPSFGPPPEPPFPCEPKPQLPTLHSDIGVIRRGWRRHSDDF